MVPYIIFYFIIFLISFKIEKKWNILDFINLLILIVYSGIRYGIGTDYFLYENIYKHSYDLSLMATNRTGIGFSYLCNFFYKCGFSYQQLIFIFSTITILCFYSFFKKHSSKPGLAILLFVSLGFYTSSFNGFRQMMSLSILLWCFSLFEQKKYIKSILLAIITFFIHSSSLFGILLYIFIYILRNKQFNFILFYGISIVLSLFYNIIFPKIIMLFEQYAGYIDYNSTPGIGTYLVVLFYLFITIFIILKNKNALLKNNKNDNFIINILIIGNIVMLFQLKNWLFARIAVYCTIFVPILLSDYYEYINLKNNKSMSLLFYIFIFVYYLMYIYSFGGVVPYRTIFEQII